MKKLLLSIVLSLGLLFTSPLMAQCPMCKSAVEANIKDGNTTGMGLNTGILYLLAAPYLVVGTIGFMWWRNNKKVKAQEANIS